MGLYLNPPNMTKEQWLLIHCEQIGEIPPESHKQNGYTAAVWIDNGWMTACGLAFSDGKFQAFVDDGIDRQKIWFWVPDHLVEQFK